MYLLTIILLTIVFQPFILLNSVFALSKMLDKKNIYRRVILILILILIRFYGVRVSISLCCPSSILIYLRFSMSTDGSLPLVVSPCLSHYFIILISCLSRSDVFILTFRDASSHILIHLCFNHNRLSSAYFPLSSLYYPTFSYRLLSCLSSCR